MDTQDTPANPISSLLDNPVVQIAIFVVSVLIILAMNPNRRFNVWYLLGSVVGLIVIAMVLDALVWLICLLGGVRLSKKQFTRYFFGIYIVVIFLQLVASFISNMAS